MDVADRNVRESTITFKCMSTFPTKSFMCAGMQGYILNVQWLTSHDCNQEKQIPTSFYARYFLARD